jgi:DNA polymerase elongation subunit (family B)
MAKKRYVSRSELALRSLIIWQVGWKYENPDDQEAVFDAKGIETVRRDGCIAQAKMTEQCLKLVPKAFQAV